MVHVKNCNKMMLHVCIICLQVTNSLQTAEQLISDMRDQLLRLYQNVIKPSDSKASDLLEYSELIAHLKETFDSLNDEVFNYYS